MVWFVEVWNGVSLALVSSCIKIGLVEYSSIFSRFVKKEKNWLFYSLALLQQLTKIHPRKIIQQDVSCVVPLHTRSRQHHN